MASNTYGRFYENDHFIISNTDVEKFDFGYRVPKEAMERPPLKMTVLRCKHDHCPKSTIIDFCDDAAWEYNHPEFAKNYLQALQGKLDGWKMTTVVIGIEIFRFYFATNRSPFIKENGEKAGDSMLECYMYGEVELLFEMDYHDGLPPICHKISYTNHSESEHGMVIKITKMIGQRKIRKIEMREDDFAYYKEGYYCRVTEY